MAKQQKHIYIHIDLFRYRMREEVKSVAHGGKERSAWGRKMKGI